MKTKIKFYKTINKIKKKIIQIIFKKYNFIIGKKNILNINHIKITKDFSYIYIYINFLNQKKKNIINNIIKYLQKSEWYIKKKINIKLSSKIYFKYDKFNIKKNQLLKKIKLATQISNINK